MSCKESITLEEVSVDQIEDRNTVSPTDEVLNGNIVHRNYILNDSNALKKKLRHEGRPDPFDLGTDAKNGANVVVLLRTSFFEHVKKEFIGNLLKNKDIEKVDNGLGSKVASGNSGDAFVEYSCDISFKYQGDSYTTKLTAYTTTCKLMFQPVKGKG